MKPKKYQYIFSRILTAPQWSRFEYYTQININFLYKATCVRKFTLPVLAGASVSEFVVKVIHIALCLETSVNCPLNILPALVLVYLTKYIYREITKAHAMVLSLITVRGNFNMSASRCIPHTAG